MSPNEPSVRAGQNTGMSFCANSQRSSVGRRSRGFIHFVRPVVYRFLVVDLLAQSADEGARGPHLPALLLLREHRVEDGGQPVLELAVVVVGHDEVAYAVHAPPAEVRAVHAEVGEVRLAEAFDEVLLDPTGGGHDRVDVLVLDEVQDDLAEARGDEVRGVAEEDVALRLGADVGREVFFRFVLGYGLV